MAGLRAGHPRDAVMRKQRAQHEEIAVAWMPGTSPWLSGSAWNRCNERNFVVPAHAGTQEAALGIAGFPARRLLDPRVRGDDGGEDVGSCENMTKAQAACRFARMCRAPNRTAMGQARP